VLALACERADCTHTYRSRTGRAPSPAATANTKVCGRTAYSCSTRERVARTPQHTHVSGTRIIHTRQLLAACRGYATPARRELFLSHPHMAMCARTAHCMTPLDIDGPVLFEIAAVRRGVNAYCQTYCVSRNVWEITT